MRNRRRIVRTFEFDRIFLFATAICFAVALAVVLLSVDFGSDYITVKSRKVYFVTYATAADADEANSKAEECKSRGGAGYLYAVGDAIYAVAAAYETRASAEEIANAIDGALIETVEIKELRLPKSEAAEKLCEVFSFCAYTVTTQLNDCAAAVDKRDMSAEAAIEKCGLMKDDVQKSVGAFAALDTVSTAVKTLAENAAAELEKVLTTSGSVCSRFRYAACSIGVLARNAIAEAERA